VVGREDGSGALPDQPSHQWLGWLEAAAISWPASSSSKITLKCLKVLIFQPKIHFLGPEIVHLRPRESVSGSSSCDNQDNKHQVPHTRL
jgi:hypothetical protein